MGSWLIKVYFVFCFCSSVLSIHTSDKLDFGDTTHRTSLVRSEKQRPIKITRILDTISSPSEHISVSCGSTGCNTTNSNNSVETEVVVRVKTNVNLDKSQDRKEVDDISDVPIVVGYRGSAPDETPNEEQFRGFSPVTPEPNDISSISDFSPLKPLYTDSPILIGRRYGEDTYRPMYTASPVSIGGRYRPHGLSYDSRHQHDAFNYPLRTSEGQFTTPSPYGYYEPSSTTSRTPNRYYDSSSQRTEIPNRYYDTLVPRTDISNSYYDYSSPRTVEINGMSSPLALTFSDLNRRNNDYNTYKEYDQEQQIPYLEHTYIKHYFGEEPPPHTFLYPKSNNFNPVEFKNIPRNKWRPVFSNGRQNKYAFSNPGSNFVNSYTSNYNHPIPYSHNHQKGHGNAGCACREERTDDNSNPYAAASVNHHISLQKKNPGASIDDKLAPLN